MSRRSHSYTHTLYDFIDEVYIVCPKCSSKALVHAPSSTDNANTDGKMICSLCGYSKSFHESWNGTITLGDPVDPYFKFPLWLTKECCNEILWAYNYEHLNFLKSHIGSPLRERNGDTKMNKSIGSRLPRWMTSAKNRQEVLKHILILLKK